MRLSYLWIDSLCIVQDDESDWKREAVQMAQVYRESFCTISALSSGGGDGGCRVNAGDEQVDQLRYVDLDIGEHRIRLVETETNMSRAILQWDVEYGDDDFKSRAWGKNPLRTRAWTFQERELSVRSIHFSKQTMLWECLEMKGSTEIPHSVVQRYDEFKPVEAAPVSSPQGKTDASQREFWYGKVEDYSSRFLSVESDKIIAIAGFARYFKHDMLKEGTYLAGLWKEHFPGCLLWRVRRDLTEPGENHPFAAFQPRRPMSYRAPSWSWASLDGEITYASQRIVQGPEPPAMARPWISLCKIGGFESSESEFNFSRGPHDASIIVRGQMVQGTFQYLLTEAPVEVYDYKRQLYNSHGDVMGFFYPDIMLEVQDLTQVSCLAVFDEVYGSADFKNEYGDPDEYSERVMGIALDPIPEYTGLFRRVGLIRWMKRSAFVNIEWSDIKII